MSDGTRRPEKPRTGLSKSKFVQGCQCPKLLWWATYEPDAPELVPDAALDALFAQGNEVGQLARARFPGGVLVDLDHRDPRREPRTRELLEAGAPAVFEATFIADRTYAAIDVLLRAKRGFTLIEVKAGTRADEKYVLDAALQAHVARSAGIDVRRVEIMHLNPEYVHPGPEELFVRADVTEQAEALLPGVPAKLRELRAVLQGDLPDVRIGRQCRDPMDCPFIGRCWPTGRDSVLLIPRMRFDRRFALHHGGRPTVADLPADEKLTAVQQRHRRAVESGEAVVEHVLREALEPYRCRLGFLDFETVSRAVPVWDGTRPWEMLPAQFSYHEGRIGGPYTHEEFIASPGADPRRDLARRLVEVTRAAERVVMYTDFEAGQIRYLQRTVPELAAELGGLLVKLIDLKKTVEQHVYHPEFRGSFSIKQVLPALVPGMSYADVAIADGNLASALLGRMVFDPGGMSAAEIARTRADLLAYCGLDTLAMVKLLERLDALAR